MLEDTQRHAHITSNLGLICHGSHVETTRLLGPVSFQMAQKVSLHHKVPGTEVALVTFVASVSANVRVQVGLLRKGLTAVVTLVWAFACVCSFMVLHARKASGGVAARKALPHTVRPRNIQMR